MSTELIKAITFITLALIFYTIGVWSEKKQGELKVWHVVIFYIGLLCDALGTHFMSEIAGGFKINLHGVTVVIVRNNEESKAKFHKFSIIVWIIWLIPYFTGMIVGMSRIH